VIKAIIALLTESGLRLSELTNIKVNDINWETVPFKSSARVKKKHLRRLAIYQVVSKTMAI